jgi:hypothetical protein
MDVKIEERVCINFYAKLGKSATETLGMLHEAFGKHSLSRTAVFEWHSHFKAGRVSVEYDECSGRPSASQTTENGEKLRELIHEDRRRTIHELEDYLGSVMDEKTGTSAQPQLAPFSRQHNHPHVPRNHKVCD